MKTRDARSLGELCEFLLTGDNEVNDEFGILWPENLSEGCLSFVRVRV